MTNLRQQADHIRTRPKIEQWFPQRLQQCNRYEEKYNTRARYDLVPDSVHHTFIKLSPFKFVLFHLKVVHRNLQRSTTTTHTFRNSQLGERQQNIVETSAAVVTCRALDDGGDARVIYRPSPLSTSNKASVLPAYNTLHDWFPLYILPGNC